MKVAKYMNEDTLIRKSIEVLMEKIGPVETFRFMNIPRKKGLKVLDGIENGKKC